MNKVANLHRTQVDITGLLDVLGHNLYSRPEVAIRELIQNAHDSCNRRRIEAADPFEAEIAIGCSAADGTVWVEDTGSGLTAEEIVDYLATIGSGYTRVLRRQEKGAELIGAFGLGFLTAYMIGRRVDVWTTSYSAPDTGAHFTSETGQHYILDEMPPRTVGTRVLIHLKDDYKDMARRDHLMDVLRYYCLLLPIPIWFGEDRERINGIVPPWRGGQDNAPDIRRRKERLEFAEFCETNFTPLCAMPIAREEAGQGQGLLWVHDASTYGNADNRRLGVYVRGMQVAHNERELLPAWAGFVGGVFESDGLTPTASRETLQKNDAYEAAQAHIERQLTAGLAALAEREPEVWRSVLRRHNEALIGAAVSDKALFEILCEQLHVPSSEGDLTLPQIVEASGGKLYIALGEDSDAEEVIARTMGVPIVNGFRYGAVPFCTGYAALRSIKLVRLGTDAGNRELFPAAELEDEPMARLARWFGGDGRNLVVSRFAPDFLPLVVLPDREAELKAYFESDEADRHVASGALALARLYTDHIEKKGLFTVVINLDAPVIEKLLAAEPAQADTAAGLLSSLADVLSSRQGGHGKTALASALRRYSEILTGLLG